MKKFFRKLGSNQGFSLVELIVVIVIILVLAAVMVPSLNRYIKQANEAVLVREARDMVNGTCIGIIDAYTLYPADYKSTVKLSKYTPVGEKYGFFSSYLLATQQGNANSPSTDAKSIISKGLLEYLSRDVKNTQKFKFYNGIISGGFDVSGIPQGESAFLVLYNKSGGIVFAQYAKNGYMITFDGKNYKVTKGGKFITYN